MICQSCSFSPHNDSVKRIMVLWQRTTKKKRTQKVYNRSKMTSSYFPNENHSTITNVTTSVPSHKCSITERSSRNVKHNLNYHHRYHYPNNNKNTGTAMTKITELYPLKVSYDYQHDDERLWLSPPRRRGPLIIEEVPHDNSAASLTTTVRLPTSIGGAMSQLRPQRTMWRYDSNDDDNKKEKYPTPCIPLQHNPQQPLRPPPVTSKQTYHHHLHRQQHNKMTTKQSNNPQSPNPPFPPLTRLCRFVLVHLLETIELQSWGRLSPVS